LEEAALGGGNAGNLRPLGAPRGEWDKLKCAELLFVRGLGNKEAAACLQISEQSVANQKFEFLAKLRSGVRQQNLSVDVFPELQEALTGSPPMQPSDHDLRAYLDEAPAGRAMAQIEQQFRGDPQLVRRLAQLVAGRDGGMHALGDIWRRHRLSCPARAQLESHLSRSLTADESLILSSTYRSSAAALVPGQSQGS